MAVVETTRLQYNMTINSPTTATRRHDNKARKSCEPKAKMMKMAAVGIMAVVMVMASEP